MGQLRRTITMLSVLQPLNLDTRHTGNGWKPKRTVSLGFSEIMETSSLRFMASKTGLKDEPQSKRFLLKRGLLLTLEE